MPRPRKSTLRTAEAAAVVEAPPVEPRDAAIGMADDAEEQAELIGYRALATLTKQAQGSMAQIAALCDDLVTMEVAEPAVSAIDEESETTVEVAKLGAILAFCGHVTGTIYGIQDLARRMLVQCGGGATGNGYDGPVSPGMGMLEGAEDASTSAAGYLTRLGKALAKIKLPDDHPLAANLKATRARIEAATSALAQPKAAAAAPTPCGCGAAEGDMDMTKAERVKALIAKGTTQFIEADQAYLETLCENRLATLEAIESPAPAPEPVVAATIDEYLAAAPEALKPVVSEHQQIVAEKRAAAAARKAELVSTLKAAQAEFTEDELAAMAADQLERIARVAAAAPKPPVEATPDTDFSGKGAPRAAAKNGEKDDAPPPPIDMTARILASRKSA